MTQTYVGMDIAQDQLEVRVSCEPGPWQGPHNEVGIATVCERLTAVSPDRMVVEATRGWQIAVAGARQAAGRPVAVVNPRHARDFARSLGAHGGSPAAARAARTRCPETCKLLTTDVAPNNYKGIRPASTSMEDKDRRRSEHGNRSGDRRIEGVSFS